MSVECLFSTTPLPGDAPAGLGTWATTPPSIRASFKHNRPMSVYRQVKCPHGVAGKASALSAGKRQQVECPYRVACKASALYAGTRVQVECPHVVACKLSTLGMANDTPKSAYYPSST